MKPNSKPNSNMKIAFFKPLLQHDKRLHQCKFTDAAAATLGLPQPVLQEQLQAEAKLGHTWIPGIYPGGSAAD
jgi:hypothetical protein